MSAIASEELLFRDEDFEDEKFDDAEFVAKYRRVITLESLREQLLTYNSSVRQELYAIINRDYKDFITISTKLDGLDTRLELIQKPLFDLQINVSSLHNGVTTSLRAIKDKIQHQSMVAEQKLKVKQLIDAIDNLKIVQQAVHGDLVEFSEVTSKEEPQLHRQQRSHYYRNGLLSSLPSKENHLELFSCMEYERTSAALAVSVQNLTGIETSKALTDFGVVVNIKELNDEVRKMKKSLEEKMLSHIEMSFANAYKSESTVNEALPNSPSVAQISIEMRSFLHCVRGLMFLKSEKLVPAAFIRAVIDPFVKLNFTFGKIDGKEGRGSFSGLSETLNSLIQAIQRSRLINYLNTLEDRSWTTVTTSHDLPRVDLILDGIWKPISQLLTERFSAMYTIGITQIFSRCYLATESFINCLATSFVKEEYQISVLDRILSSPLTDIFYRQWKFDMYLQLRFREISQRVDRICEITLQTKVQECSKPDASNPLRFVTEQFYQSILALNSVNHPTSSSLSSSTVFSLQIDTSQLSVLADSFQQFLKNQNTKYYNEFFKSFALELLIAANKFVSLKPVAGKFLLLIDRLMKRLALQVCLIVVMDANSTLSQELFNLTKSEFDELRMQILTQVVTSDKVVGTSIEKGSFAASTTDELIVISADLLSFSLWLLYEYPEYAIKNSPFFSSEKGCKLSITWPHVVTKTIQQSSKGLIYVLQLTLRQIVHNVIHECAKSLGNVKAIAGKYRMTNKPAPTAASPYVSSIFSPFRKIMDSYGTSLLYLLGHIGADVIVHFEERGSLSSKLLNCDSARELYQLKNFIIQSILQSYYDQVVSLLGTVKQMDSALQRRAIKGRNAVPAGDLNVQLSDSEKISLQLRLDVERCGDEVRELGLDPAAFVMFQRLRDEIQNTDFSK